MSDATKDASSGNVTPLFPDRTAAARLAAAHDQVILEGGADAAAEPGVLVRRMRLDAERPPARPVPMPHGPRLGLLRLREVPLAFYRFLFDGVGRGHHWRMLAPGETSEALEQRLNGSGREVHVLYVGGAPAGFFELSLERLASDRMVTIECFGLMDYARGRGLSRWFLHEAIRAAWEKEPALVRLWTNSLDSPIALRLYQEAGFEVTDTIDGTLPDGDET